MKHAITGCVGYLVLGRVWFCNTKAVENYQLLLVLDSFNSFCHTILQLHNVAGKKNPAVLTVAGLYLTVIFADIMCFWR